MAAGIQADHGDGSIKDSESCDQGRTRRARRSSAADFAFRRTETQAAWGKFRQEMEAVTCSIKDPAPLYASVVEGAKDRPVFAPVSIDREDPESVVEVGCV
ncbi:hypothetical protein [Bradyrhizobium japonicum]|uniref:hypothetical protein n=1 Tax=Bradyrhizobium japonicum TaxID=375 RepID=UPI001BA6608A|nr:hypothetical protein [Bradyrhizobium japonicum]MBR0911772.1 hypothetical protein [Bradyrhizobium japonicum]